MGAGDVEKAVLSIRRKGSRAKGKGRVSPNLRGPASAAPCSASDACRSALGQQEGVSWAWAPCPDDWTGATWATSPGLKGEEEPHVSSQPPSPITVFGEKTE